MHICCCSSPLLLPVGFLLDAVWRDHALSDACARLLYHLKEMVVLPHYGMGLVDVCVCMWNILLLFVVLCNFSLSSSFTSYCSHNCWSNSWLLCVWARFVSSEEGFMYEKKKGGRENLAIYVSFIFLYSCWLSVERNVIWAFIVPMLIIIIVCWYGA